MMRDFEISPLRPLSDFLLQSARFQIPDFNDPERWANRVCNNLLYYQSNYFLTAILTFLVVGLIHPAKLFVGLFSIIAIYSISRRVIHHRYAVRRKHRPLFNFIVIVLGFYFIAYVLKAIFVLIFGIMLPVILIFLHSSLRLRNIKNKIANKVVGLRRTPMGILLETLDAVEVQKINELKVTLQSLIDEKGDLLEEQCNLATEYTVHRKEHSE